MGMNIPFLDNWRKRHGMARGVGVVENGPGDPEGMAQLLAECEALRGQAERAGVELGATVESLVALDQVVPRWRDDPETLCWLGTDAGLYLGTVLVRTVPGACWRLRADGQPVVRLPSDREIDVVQAGRDWAASGTPELSRVYAEVAGG